MSGVLDTNLLLYAANRDGAEYPVAHSFLEGVLEDAGVWYLTDGICYEFLRVATHRRVFPCPLTAAEAMGFLEVLLGQPGISLLRPGEGHWRVLRTVVRTLHAPAGNLFFDVRTAALMQEHGVRRIYTADTDLLQFDGIEVINPLKASIG